MRNTEVHLSDAELIQLADGEAGRDARRIEAHLTACWQCRARRMELERTIADYVQVHRYPSGKLPPMDESRARLLAALVQLSAVPVSAAPVRRHGLAYGGAVACLVLGFGLVLYFSVLRAGAAPVPDQQLTPGATRIVSRDDICRADAVEGFYPISAVVAVSVFESYRIENPHPRSYEVDYLITPALGGADDIRNLWPQPYSSGVWNAHVKDALEAHLHDLVCTGKLELATAQRDIAEDWIAAYRKYFKTRSPLPDHIAFSVDPPWEH
jgi:hypothetical protein